MCWYLACMYVCVRESDIQELELQTAVNPHGVLGIEPQSFGRETPAHLTAKLSLQPHEDIFLTFTCCSVFWKKKCRKDIWKYTLIIV